MASPKYTLRRVGATATPAQWGVLANSLRPFYRGNPGASGGAASISADAGNGLSAGADGGIFAPQAFALSARFSFAIGIIGNDALTHLGRITDSSLRLADGSTLSIKEASGTYGTVQTERRRQPADCEIVKTAA